MFVLHDEILAGEYQRPAAELTRRAWDVIVAGAGPAGGIAALQLARAGHGVLLLDRLRFPREKVCGDALTVDAIGALARAGLLDAARELGHTSSMAHLYSPSGVQLRLKADYLTLERRVLDGLVARAATTCGAAFHFGDVLEAKARSDGSFLLEVKGVTHELTARVLLVATGAALPLAREAGVKVRQHPSAAGVRCYIRSSLQIDEMIGAYQRAITPGYGWIFPMGGGLYNVGTIVFLAYRRGTPQELKQSLVNFLRDFAPARELLAAGQRVGPLKGSVLRGGLEGGQVGSGNVLALGETAATTLPLTGEGIGRAMLSGELAARVVHGCLQNGEFGSLQEYSRMLERDRPRYRGFRRAEKVMARPWLNDALARRVSRNPELEDRLGGVLRDTNLSTEVFSFRALLKSLLS